MAEIKLPPNKREDSIIKAESLDYEPSPQGLGYEFFHSMRINKNAIAQIDAATGETDTYGALLQRSVRTALKLVADGFTSEDIIALCTFNHLDSCVPIFSGLFLGAKVAPLDPSLSLTDTAHLLNLTKPKIIFTSPNAINLIETALNQAGLSSKIVVFGQSDKHAEFREFIAPIAGEDAFRPYPIKGIKETAIILFSSGTTGLPKGICLSHYSLMVQLVNTIECWNLGNKYYFSNYTKERADDGISVMLGFTTLYWISAMGVLNCSTMAGIARIICAKFDAATVWRLIDKYKIGFLTCTSFEASKLCSIGKPEGIDVSSLKIFLTAGTPLSKHLMWELRRLLPGTFVSNAYGQTEICGAVTMFNATKPEDIEAQNSRPNACGRPMPGVQYKIVNPDTEEVLGVNQPGELRYKTEFVMNGYYNVDSSSAFDAEGWIKSGDVVYYDDALCFYVVDRMKDMFKYKSWHIVPAMLEAVIKEHPAVKHAVVIGIPDKDPHIGDLPMGVVVLKENMVATPEDIEKFVACRVIDRQKLRGGVRIIGEIPVTPSGKPKRKELKDLVLSGNL